MEEENKERKEKSGRNEESHKPRGLGVRGPAARGRCGERVGRRDPIRRRCSPPPQSYLPADTQEAERASRAGHPRRERGSLGQASAPRQVQRAHPRPPAPAALGPSHVSRSRGVGPASVEHSLSPVLGVPPQVSTPGALGAVYWRATGPPPFHGPSRGCHRCSLPWAAFLLESSRVRTSAPSPTSPSLIRFPASRLRGLRETGWRHVGKVVQETSPWGGKRRGVGGDSEAGRGRLAGHAPLPLRRAQIMQPGHRRR